MARSMPRVLAGQEQVAWASQATANDFAVLGTAWDKRGLLNGMLAIRNTHASLVAKIIVEGSADGTNFDFAILAEETLSAETTKVVEITKYYAYVRIRVASDVGGSHATIVARACALAA